MALNVFSNSTAIDITNTGSRATDITLTPNSPGLLRVTATANIRIQLPDPTVCKNKVIEIANTASGFTAAVHQYNATTPYAGAVIGLPNGGATGTLRSAALAVGAAAVGADGATYNSARYWCDGSDWILLSANINYYWA